MPGFHWQRQALAQGEFLPPAHLLACSQPQRRLAGFTTRPRTGLLQLGSRELWDGSERQGRSGGRVCDQNLIRDETSLWVPTGVN